jgi:hypothetical protein
MAVGAFLFVLTLVIAVILLSMLSPGGGNAGHRR